MAGPGWSLEKGAAAAGAPPINVWLEHAPGARDVVRAVAQGERVERPPPLEDSPEADSEIVEDLPEVDESRGTPATSPGRWPN